MVISEQEFNRNHRKYRLIEEGGYMTKKKVKAKAKKKSKKKSKKKKKSKR